MSIPAKLRQEVIAAASARCEYCQTSSRITGTPLVMEHVLPKSLGGSDKRANLAASCYRCNEFKGVKTHVRDPESGQLVALFNPRVQIWADEFAWSNGGTHVVGKTAIGRATVLGLRLNNDQLVEARSLWIGFRWHPPLNSLPEG